MTLNEEIYETLLKISTVVQRDSSVVRTAVCSCTGPFGGTLLPVTADPRDATASSAGTALEGGGIFKINEGV